MIRDGNFVYRKGYGLASLELGVSLSSQSVFYMASVSKQFTDASVVLAAERGYLSLDDDVHKYIPELPDYGHVITLRQMIRRTSGFRDFITLLHLSSLDVADFNSPEEILKIVVRQEGLNNIPGDEWIYSDTNYFLLGIVIKRATKKSLAEFAAENMFQRLGMSHTLFYVDHTLVVPGRVPAYDSGPHNSFRVDWSTTAMSRHCDRWHHILCLVSQTVDLRAWENIRHLPRERQSASVRQQRMPQLFCRSPI